MKEVKGTSKLPRDRDNAGGGKVSKETGVMPDYISAWMHVSNAMLADNGDEVIRELATEAFVPVLRYEDYVRKMQPARAEEIISESDPTRVATINDLVDTYNAQVASLAESKDFATAVSIWNQIDLLVRGQESRQLK